MATPAPVPTGQSAPFAIITEDDHRAWILIAAAFGMSMTLLASLIRTFVRYSIQSGWGLDDILAASATVLSFVQSSIILAAGANGLGASIKLLSQKQQDQVQEMYYASNLFYVLVLGLSRLSTIFFLRRLTPIVNRKWSFTILISLVIAWTVAVFLAAAIQCDVSHPWLLTGQNCGTGWILRWEVAETIGGLFEIAIAAMSVWLVWNIQTTLGNKANVVIAFSFRLIMLVFIGLRLSTFDKTGLSLDPTLDEARFICWTQAELNYSVISATIPIARQLLASLNTNYGHGHGFTSAGTGYANGSGNNTLQRAADPSRTDSIHMNALKPNPSRRQSKNELQPRVQTREFGDNDMNIEIVGQARTVDNAVGNAEKKRSHNIDSTSVDSNDSTKLIIQKDTTWDIRYN